MARHVFLPRVLDELWELLYEEPEALVYAGGTDLLVKLRHFPPPPHIDSPPIPLICIERIEELKTIRQEGDLIFIGSAVTYRHLLENELVREHLPVLTQAINVLGSPLIRNMGTIGGNICTASPAGDALPPLYVLNAAVELRSADSSRLVPLRSFIKGPGKTAIQDREILYGVWVNTGQGFSVHHYEKTGQRNALAISIVGMACLMNLSPDNRIEDMRLAWGSVAPTVVTLPAVEEALKGKHLHRSTLESVIPLIREGVFPIDDARASAHYRRIVSGNLILRLLEYRRI